MHIIPNSNKLCIHKGMKYKKAFYIETNRSFEMKRVKFSTIPSL